MGNRVRRWKVTSADLTYGMQLGAALGKCFRGLRKHESAFPKKNVFSALQSMTQRLMIRKDAIGKQAFPLLLSFPMVRCVTSNPSAFLHLK